MEKTINLGDTSEKFDTLYTTPEQLGEMIKKFRDITVLEQEMGIDLVTLFTAIRDGVFVKDDDNIIDLREDCLYLSYNGHRWILEPYHFGLFEFEDYGKTWALTKEELE